MIQSTHRLTRLVLTSLLALACFAAESQAQTEPDDLKKITAQLEEAAQRQKEILTHSKAADTKLDKIDSKIGGAAASEVSSIELKALEAKIAALEAKLAATPASSEAPPLATDAATAVQANLNLVWTLTAGALVFLMQAGFCCLELGLARAKNSINICMKNFLDFCVAAVAFLFIGFPLMFGETISGFVGTGSAWLSSNDNANPLWTFWFFQVVFAGTCATIVSGAMAERTKFVGYLVYAFFLSAIIYPVIGHWAWGSFGGGVGYGGTKGWLEVMGFVDFAGSSVVHGVGGACALAGIIVVGPRLGRFAKDGSPRMLVGHNLPMAALGAFILWFGWFGFNGGSTLIGDPSIGRIIVNTAIAPSVGAISAMLSMWLIQGRPDLGMVINGCLGGAVGITACCSVVTPASACVIGLVAGIIATFGTLLLEKLQLDDAVGAVPVHLFNGWWGTLCVSLFNDKGFDVKQLGVQAIGTFSMTLTAFVGCFIIFKLVDILIGLRASDEEQIDGLDFSEHSASAYPEFATTEQKLVDV